MRHPSRKIIIRICLYLKGLILALLGKFPFDELRQLERLRKQVEQDDRWLYVHPGAAMLTQRYMEMCSPQWREYPKESIAAFRYKLFNAFETVPDPTDHV